MPDLRECLKLFRFAEIYFWKVTPVCPKLLVRYFMDVKLPKLGEGADSGVVVNVFVKEGDTVASGQAIIELENEKAVASIPSTAAGAVAKIYVKAGDRIGIGQKIISVNESGASAAGAPAPAAKPVAKKAAPEKVGDENGHEDEKEAIAEEESPAS